MYPFRLSFGDFNLNAIHLLFQAFPLFMDRYLEDYRRVPVGMLGIPVGNYLDLVDAINPLLRDQDKEVSFEAALFPFIGQFDEAIKQTMADAFHWQQLAFDFHPAEPDIFGVLMRVLSVN